MTENTKKGNILEILQHPLFDVHFRGAPDSDFYYPAGFAGYLKNIRPDYPAGYCPDILFNLNTRMSSKKDQIHVSASYICHMRNYL